MTRQEAFDSMAEFHISCRDAYEIAEIAKNRAGWEFVPVSEYGELQCKIGEIGYIDIFDECVRLFAVRAE